MKIPDYYRQFQNQPSEEKKEEEKSPEMPEAGEDRKTPHQSRPGKPEVKQAVPKDKTVVFRGKRIHRKPA